MQGGGAAPSPQEGLRSSYLGRKGNKEEEIAWNLALKSFGHEQSLFLHLAWGALRRLHGILVQCSVQHRYALFSLEP